MHNDKEIGEIKMSLNSLPNSMENGLEPRANAEKMQKKHLEKSKRSRVVDGVPVPSSHTMKLRSDTIISTSLLFKLIIA